MAKVICAQALMHSTGKEHTLVEASGTTSSSVGALPGAPVMITAGSSGAAGIVTCEAQQISTSRMRHHMDSSGFMLQCILCTCAI